MEMHDIEAIKPTGFLEVSRMRLSRNISYHQAGRDFLGLIRTNRMPCLAVSCHISQPLPISRPASCNVTMASPNGPCGHDGYYPTDKDWNLMKNPSRRPHFRPAMAPFPRTPWSPSLGWKSVAALLSVFLEPPKHHRLSINMTSQRSSIEKNDTEVFGHRPSGEVHLEKLPDAIEVGPYRVYGLTPEDADFYNNYPEEKRKKTFHKVDVRLIPVLALLYLICHIDRANIGNAKIEGMVEDLGMTGVQYNTVLSIFFIPYVLFEVPSNIILKKVKRPSFYLGTLTLSWGIIMTCTGLVRNFGGLMVTRILLGVFEAGFFPGAIYLTSYWYMPKDLAVRISYFYCASALSGAFSGLLAAAIAEMDGVAGLEGWRWIFILEGLATVVMGASCFFLLIDTPTLSTRWLEPEEIRYLELSIFIKSGGGAREEAGAGGKVNWRDLKMNLTNWRIYVQAYFLVCQSALSYGIKFTLPTITKAMGFANTQAQLLSAPPYVAAAISAITFAKISDRFFWRMPFLAIPLAIVAIAYAIILSLNGALEAKKGVAYFSVVLAVVGIYPIQAAAASWNANNIAPASRRAIGIALMNCVGNVGGIVGSFMYLESEKPKYPTGFGLSLAFGGSGLIVALLLEWSYKSANARKARIAEEAKTKYTEEELFNLGDRSPLFKYVL
ncbi:major facilitator superfamily transporter [Colletotrichum orchidophilum]|uniref:Major facilitator superfamily transporter n=1 Tax=Colletotrichum orchidophilum TaxID=1209926 RepID=A0A1G4B4F9_9PEZI|nr:major facilitator superfamily transporter [Colletotrichum orchidophilum]OHE96301.1 major facilitator superfamily transporter [Colletotrichum orchidophilum]